LDEKRERATKLKKFMYCYIGFYGGLVIGKMILEVQNNFRLGFLEYYNMFCKIHSNSPLTHQTLAKSYLMLDEDQSCDSGIMP
jgi:hypothetical protein